MTTQNKLRSVIQEFFLLLNYKEETDSGKLFSPIKIHCSQRDLLDGLNECLRRMKDRRLNEASLREEVKKFFWYLDLEGDPIYIGSCRVMMTARIHEVLERLKEMTK